MAGMGVRDLVQEIAKALVDIPDQVEHANESGALRLLYLGRLHPKKGIENLLQACKWLKDHTGLSWSLEIAGTGDALYVESLQAKIDELGLQGQRKDIATQRLLPGQVEMVGEVIGKAKERLFANADLLVVPSYVENFGNVVAEALAKLRAGAAAIVEVALALLFSTRAT